MRYCGYIEKLCDKLIFSESVTVAATGEVVINIPAGSYNNGERYCIVIAQAIPIAATIVAPVVITIGDGTVEYPLINGCCAQVTACGIRTRTRYSVKVVTTADGGSFKMLGKPCCAPSNVLAAIDGGATA